MYSQSKAARLNLDTTSSFWSRLGLVFRAAHVTANAVRSNSRVPQARVSAKDTSLNRTVDCTADQVLRIEY